jgi:hypothetical protein
VLVAGLGKVTVRVLGRAVQRDEGVEDDVRHVESFRNEAEVSPVRPSSTVELIVV